MTAHQLRYRMTNQIISIMSGVALIVLIASGPSSAQSAPTVTVTMEARK